MLKDNQREDQSAAALAFLLSKENSIVLDTKTHIIMKLSTIPARQTQQL